MKLSGAEKRLLTSETLTLCLQEDPKLYQELVKTFQLSLSKEDLASLFSEFSLIVINYISAVSTPSSSPQDRPRQTVYPIEVPALGGCTTFLDGVKIIDGEPRINTYVQFVSSLHYCCDVYGDKSSPEIVDAVTGAMEKRHKNCTRDVSRIVELLLSNTYPKITEVLRWSKDNKYGLVGHWINITPLKMPLQYSKHVFLDLHDGPSYCAENNERGRRCKVAVDVSLKFKDDHSWPVVTLKLVTDQATLDNQTKAHFHQDLEFLRNISVMGSSDGFWVPFIICNNLDTPTDSILEFYKKCNNSKKIGVFVWFPRERIV
eukprot:sb/3466941/